MALLFLILNEGKGIAWKGEDEGKQVEKDEDFDLYSLMEKIQKGEAVEESRETELVELDDKRRLGIATLGALKQHPRISAFRRFVEGWYLSYFRPDAARSLPLAGPQEHLNIHGDNLGNVVQFMERDHPRKFQSILDNIATKIPGINKISTERSPDGRLLLRFNDKGFQDPFYAQQMSDGTLKIFAYLLLLEDPSPRHFYVLKSRKMGFTINFWNRLLKNFETMPFAETVLKYLSRHISLILWMLSSRKRFGF